MRVIAFTGLPGAGKTEAVEVARARGIPVVRMGDAVWAEVERRGLAKNDANVGGVADDMRKTHGMAVWAERTADKVMGIAAPLVVIDGVRNPEEVACFRRRLGKDFTLVAIEATEDVRRKRLLERGRADDIASAAEFERRERRERSWGIETAMAGAELNLRNDGDLAKFLRAVENLFSATGQGRA